jgi:hypothetical protein
MFRFTIRDVLWLTVVVALGLGWGIENRRAAARESAWKASFQSALEQLSFHVQEEPATFDSPIGPWQMHCTIGVSPPD